MSNHNIPAQTPETKKNTRNTLTRGERLRNTGAVALGASALVYALYSGNNLMNAKYDNTVTQETEGTPTVSQLIKEASLRGPATPEDSLGIFPIVSGESTGDNIAKHAAEAGYPIDTNSTFGRMTIFLAAEAAQDRDFMEGIVAAQPGDLYEVFKEDVTGDGIPEIIARTVSPSPDELND